MEMCPAPGRKGPEYTPHSAGGRLPLHDPSPTPRATPVVGEAQEVKAAWTSAAVARGRFRRRRLTFPRRPWRGALEGQQPRFVGMDREPEFAETLRQHLPDPLGILLTGEAHHQVIRIANQEGSAVQTRLHFFDEPDV